MTNSRFEELERRCKSIRYKKRLKAVLYIFVSACIIVATLLYGYYKLATKSADSKILKKVTFSATQDKNKTKSKLPKKSEKNRAKVLKTKEKKIAKVKIPKERYTLLAPPMINIPDSIKSSKQEINKQKDTPKQIQKKERKNIHKTDTQKEQTFKLITKEADTETILQKNYNVNKDFDSAMKLAIYYLKTRSYLKAIYWAKNANKLNSTKDISWIVYAKAKFALGQKKDAIKSLQTFLDIFYSQRAQQLLKKYKQKAKKVDK